MTAINVLVKIDKINNKCDGSPADVRDLAAEGTIV